MSSRSASPDTGTTFAGCEGYKNNILWHSKMSRWPFPLLVHYGTLFTEWPELQSLIWCLAFGRYKPGLLVEFFLTALSMPFPNSCCANRNDRLASAIESTPWHSRQSLPVRIGPMKQDEFKVNNQSTVIGVATLKFSNCFLTMRTPTGGGTPIHSNTMVPTDWLTRLNERTLSNISLLIH